MIDHRHLDLLHELSTDQNPHSGRTFLEHLKGTHDLLEKWANPQPVCVAGLFHSIYGTEYYTVKSADVADRRRIAEVIGDRAEELAFLFCMTDRPGFFRETAVCHPVLIERATKNRVTVSHETLAALIEIEIANCTEQYRSETASEKVVAFMRLMLEAGKDHMTTSAREEFATLLNARLLPGTTSKGLSDPKRANQGHRS